MIQKAMVFIYRDHVIATTYKIAFVFEIAATVFPVLSYYFIAKLVGGAGASSLSPYGGEYFPFAMVGIVFTQYFMLALKSFADTIRRGQMAGCLEAMMSTPTTPGTIAILSSLYVFVAKLIHIVLVFVLGWILLGVDIQRANFMSVVIVIMLAVTAFSGIGLISAALIVVLKKGDPITWFYGAASSLFSGALFPIAVLPEWMQALSRVFPMTYALEATRLALLKGYSLGQLWREVAVLGAMGVVFVPLGICCFSYAVQKGRRDGSLMHY